MDERLTEEGIEHLQTAARELISAARIFLDVVEEFVEEPERVAHSLTGVVEAFKDIAGRPVQPWEAHAWTASTRGSSGRGSGGSDRSGSARGGGQNSGGSRRNRLRDDEPTLFPTEPGTDDMAGSSTEGLDGDRPARSDDGRSDNGSTRDSEWAVWDDDDDALGPVVDIRVNAQRSGAKESTRKKRATSGSGRSTVKRITVD